MTTYLAFMAFGAVLGALFTSVGLLADRKGGGGMNKENVLEVADIGFGSMEQAHSLLAGLYNNYFCWNFENPERRKAASKAISEDLEYISAVLWVADNLVFEYNRDMSAAMGLETVPVEAFVKNTRKLYGTFLDASRTEKEGGAE